MKTRKQLMSELIRKKNKFWKENGALITHRYEEFEAMREIGILQGKILMLEQIKDKTK
jgi:hypothetical protein